MTKRKRKSTIAERIDIPVHGASEAQDNHVLAPPSDGETLTLPSSGVRAAASRARHLRSRKNNGSKSTGAERNVEHDEVKVDADGKAGDVLQTDATSPISLAGRKQSLKIKRTQDRPLRTRAVEHPLLIGAHVSSAGGIPNAIHNGVHIGANAFALFLKSQRKWSNPVLSEEHRAEFVHQCQHHGFDSTRHVLPHGSYLVNLAHTSKERTQQAYAAFLDDLQRCEALGIRLYNFHPGNTGGVERDKAIQHLANNLNRAHAATSNVITVLENMAAGGNVIGSKFEDLRDIIASIDDKSRVGVCIDTCHAFAAGYDLRTPEAFAFTMSEFHRIVGLEYLRAIHMNDSKAPLASHRDLHANIGTGYIGLLGFHCIINDPRIVGIPIILETPIEVRDEDGALVLDGKGKPQEDKGIWAREIQLLESLHGMSTQSDEFQTLERQLCKQGAPERQRLLAQFERKLEKTRKATRNQQQKS